MRNNRNESDWHVQPQPVRPVEPAKGFTPNIPRRAYLIAGGAGSLLAIAGLFLLLNPFTTRPAKVPAVSVASAAAVAAPTPTATATPVPTTTVGAGRGGGSLEAQKTVNDGLEALYGEAVGADPGGEAVQQKLVNDYRALKALAERSSVAFPSGCNVAQRAYQVRAFLWAKVAWEDDCYLSGQFKSGDHVAYGYGFYGAILRNLGKVWAKDGDSQRVRQKGLSFLVACTAVAAEFRLNLDECRQDLQELGYPDPARWPSAATSPLLVAVP